MPRLATVHFASLRSSLVKLPLSVYGPLLERSVRPQSLAVHLTNTSNPSRNSAYVGWSGLASASSLAQFSASNSSGSTNETIEIDPQYAQALGFNQGDVLEIGLIYDLPVAITVGTEPIGADDWEIIETHASHIESTLLSQARVANIGQEIDLWVLGHTRVRLRVVSLSPEAPALLLSTDTEVSVAPKLHQKPGEKERALTSSTTKDAASKQDKLQPQVLRLVPSRLVPNLPDPPAADWEGGGVIAYVSNMTMATLLGLRYLPYDDYVEREPFSDVPASDPPPPSSQATTGPLYSKYLLRANIYRLSPPADPTDPSSKSQPPPLPPAERVLHPSDPAGRSRDMEDDKEDKCKGMGSINEVWIMFDQALYVPYSHIVITGALDAVLGGSLRDWDLISVTPASERKSVPPALIATLTPPTMEPSPESPLAGVDDIMKQCTDWCICTLALHGQQTSVRGVPTLLLTGRQGSGKTSIVQAVAKTLQDDPRAFTYTRYIDLTPLADRPVQTLKALFEYWFNDAYFHSPTILILENLEAVLGAESENMDSFRVRHLTELFIMKYGPSARTMSPNARGIMILATASSRAAVHPLLNKTHVIRETVQLKSPNKDARKQILARVLRDRFARAPTIETDEESPINYAALATRTDGYSAGDLEDLVVRAIHVAATRRSEGGKDARMVLRGSDFDAAQADFVPLSLRDINLHKSTVEWSDIGGLHEPRRVLRETLEWPTKYAQIFAQSPLRLRSGLLLYGYPGCGKTLLASAVAKECGLNFISIKGPELLNKYIGASEKSVRDLFERATAAKPCVLFFDEFDSIAPKRGHDSTGVTDRVVNQMLTEMDGAEGLEGVYVLAATSRPDLIDSALLRPGRLDKSLLCNMPDKEERKEILQAVARKMIVSAEMDWDEIAESTEEFSGADLQALLYNAHLEVVQTSLSALTSDDKGKGREDEEPLEYTVLGMQDSDRVMTRAEEAALEKRLRRIRDAARSKHSNLTTRVRDTPPPKPEITPAHVRQALKTTRPSVSRDEKERLGRIYEAFINDRSGKLPVPPASGGVGNRVSLM